MANDTELLPAYLVVGDDALKREAVENRLHKRLEQSGDLAFNSDVFEGSQCTGDDVVAACNTIPFASRYRLVQINDAEKLKKAATDAIADYLDDPSASSVLLVVAEKLAKNNKLYKAISALGGKAVIDCARPKSYKMQAHVRAMAPTHGVTVTARAASKLLELVGDDTVRLNNELKKLALSHSGSDPIDADEVEELVAETTLVKPWEFIDAFSARDIKRCVRYFPRIDSATPISLLAMCVARIRELICTKSILAFGGTMEYVASELSVPSWKIKNHYTWASNFTSEELKKALVSSIEAEQNMKSGTSQDAAFLDWVLRVLRR